MAGKSSAKESAGRAAWTQAAFFAYLHCDSQPLAEVASERGCSSFDEKKSLKNKVESSRSDVAKSFDGDW